MKRKIQSFVLCQVNDMLIPVRAGTRVGRLVKNIYSMILHIGWLLGRSARIHM
ncbi:hypothetical protein ANN_23125 [Periplaneta americana]|uniref:Uncharacterized protein n=1 Tax=Periplaneta americana TaxID=6978 RepID=A0ABQ8SK79_PERAM|nr:hypothetical protein ANN_23125 [Periplaneta americana]